MHLLFFFFPTIEKHLDFMEVRILTINIYLSNDKLCLKCFFKASYFHPTRIPYVKKNAYSCLSGGLYSGRHFVALRNSYLWGYLQLASMQKVV